MNEIYLLYNYQMDKLINGFELYQNSIKRRTEYNCLNVTYILEMDLKNATNAMCTL